MSDSVIQTNIAIRDSNEYWLSSKIKEEKNFSKTRKYIWHIQKNYSFFAFATINMQRIQLHIETKKCFNPEWDYTVSGACNAHD